MGGDAKRDTLKFISSSLEVKVEVNKNQILFSGYKVG